MKAVFSALAGIRIIDFIVSIRKVITPLVRVVEESFKELTT